MLYRTDASGNLIKIAGNTNGTYGGNSLPVGSIFSSAIPQTSTNYHLLNGDSLSINGIYSGFYNLLNTLVSQGYNLTCSVNEYAEDIAKTGNCGKFVINTSANAITGTYTDSQDSSITATITVSAESFKLPTITMFIQGLSNLTNIGESLQAGLPNITGEIGCRAAYDTLSSSGAFTTVSSYDADNEVGSGSKRGSYNFNASRSSSIYGNSETVQPASTKYPYYIVLISGSALSIEANPTLSGNEQNLNSIGIGGVNYKTKVDYSTDEVDTGIKWIDGKPIYRKVFEFTSYLTISSTTWTSVNIDISQNNIETVINCRTIKNLNNDKAFWYANVALDDGDYVMLQACRDGTSFQINKIILEYTKSTT